MELIGEYIKNFRISKNLELSKISKELKISIGILESIESDYFPEHINETYLIGYIRAYAKLLQLNEDKLIKNFKTQISYNQIALKNNVSKPIQYNKNKIFFSIPRLTSFVSVIIISSSFYLLFINNNSIDHEYAMTPNVPEIFIPIIEETEMNIALEEDNEIIDENIKFFLRNNSSSAVASLPDINLDNSNKKITLKFLNSTWIQLRNIDDKIIHSKLMNQGDEYTFNSSDQLNLTAGNAGNIIIILDGIVRGKAGKAGEVIESLIINDSFKN